MENELKHNFTIVGDEKAIMEDAKILDEIKEKEKYDIEYISYIPDNANPDGNRFASLDIYCGFATMEYIQFKLSITRIDCPVFW